MTIGHNSRALGGGEPMFDEAARLDALQQLNLLDTPASETFDRITRLAARIFDLPIAAVSLTDQDRQWFKSRVGIDHDSIPRRQAPCAQVAETTGMVVIPDLRNDAVYGDSPLAASGIRFYAGVPLVTPQGHGLGALCVLGTEARVATAEEIASLSDLAAMVMAQIELQHAFGRIDPISGMPNRSQFFEDLLDLACEAPGVRRLAVMVDLARGDQIDQAARVMGSDFIDGLVQDSARTIRKLIGGKRIVYHVGATKFVFLAPRGAEATDYVTAMEGRLPELRRRSAGRFTMSPVVGVAPFVPGQTRPPDVLRALSSAAQDGRDAPRAVGFYAAANEVVHARRFRLISDFGAALGQPDQLRLVFQPRVDLAARRCIGVEALLRWQHPELGDISPAEFIPIVEQTTMVGGTTGWVLDAALAQMAHWAKSGIKLPLSLNISARNLDEPDFAGTVELYLRKHRVPADRLEIEVTESALMCNAERALDQLDVLAAAGIRIALDDFGTGYSSLAYLQKLPVQVVKIDQSFVRGLEAGSAAGRTLVGSMIALSHGLGYRVVGEGVETAEVAEILGAMGCDEAQGYHFARPLEGAALPAWLRDNAAQVGRPRAA